jgi:hypothetical protein
VPGQQLTAASEKAWHMANSQGSGYLFWNSSSQDLTMSTTSLGLAVNDSVGVVNDTSLVRITRARNSLSAGPSLHAAMTSVPAFQPGRRCGEGTSE